MESVRITVVPSPALQLKINKAILRLGSYKVGSRRTTRLSHAGQIDVNRDAELRALTRVGCNTLLGATLVSAVNITCSHHLRNRAVRFVKISLPLGSQSNGVRID